MLRRTLAAVVVTVTVAAMTGCGGENPVDTTQPHETPTPASSPGATPDAGSPGGSTQNADGYARVVMSTNMSEVFSGYAIDGTTILFQVKPGVTLDEAQCQYLKLSNGALRQSLGLKVVVDDNGTEKEC